MTDTSKKPMRFFLELNQDGNLIGSARADKGFSKADLFSSIPPVGIERTIVEMIDISAYQSLLEQCLKLERALEKIESTDYSGMDEAPAIFLTRWRNETKELARQALAEFKKFKGNK